MEDAVQKLLDKAVQSNDSGDAMRFTQAACNAANALCSLAEARKKQATSA